MAASQPDYPSQPRQTLDVMAFGHQSGRVLSDGTIVGRAEPFTKVFPSSRAVKREVGLTAWAILEDIALDARIDDEGRLVAETNVRRIADNLDVSKNTVSRHLKKLREAGFTVREETRAGSGAWGSSRYVLDPSACLERFTTTPTARDGDGGRQPHQKPVENSAAGGDSQPKEAVDNSGTKAPDRLSDAEFGGLSPCTSSWDTVEPTVSQFMGHRRLGHNNQEHACEEQPLQQQHAQQGERDTDEDHSKELLEALLAAGVDPEVAHKLLVEHPVELIQNALLVVGHRQVDNPAGWLVTAIREGWELAAEADELRGVQRRRQRQDNQARTRQRRYGQAEAALDRAERWHQAVSAALDDAQLAEVVAQVVAGLPDIAAQSVPVVRSKLTCMAARAAQQLPDRPLEAALQQTTTANLPPDTEAGQLPEPPPLAGEDPPPLKQRLHQLLDELPTAAIAKTGAGAR